MKIILSPAKKMKTEREILLPMTKPRFLGEAEEIMAWMQSLSYQEAKELWACNDKIAEENFRRFAEMDLYKEENLTPAVLAYDGIAFQYMAPAVFEDGHFDYVQDHLRILSGLYGILRGMDGVASYRLEMQARARVAGKKNLYDYWGDKLYGELVKEDRLIINLASKEYSLCVEKFLQKGDRMISCLFGELSGDKVVQKGVYAKMARGDMVRFLAEKRIEEPEGMKAYQRLGFFYDESRSTEEVYVFLRQKTPEK